MILLILLLVAVAVITVVVAREHSAGDAAEAGFISLVMGAIVVLILSGFITILVDHRSDIPLPSRNIVAFDDNTYIGSGFNVSDDSGVYTFATKDGFGRVVNVVKMQYTHIKEADATPSFTEYTCNVNRWVDLFGSCKQKYEIVVPTGSVRQGFNIDVRK